MADTYNIFISWSGERSERVAKALYDWLPMVVQTAEPWMSEEDIEKGSRGLDEIGKTLAAMGVGIICLTPENLERPWILFEAGSLSKALGDKTRVCPYLFGDLQPENVKPPLGMFQATRAVKDDTRKLVATVNRVLGGPLGDEKLDTVFERMWPELEKKLEAVPRAAAAAAPLRSEREMLAELLELSRAATGDVGWSRDALVTLLSRTNKFSGQAGVAAEARVPQSAWSGLPAYDVDVVSGVGRALSTRERMVAEQIALADLKAARAEAERGIAEGTARLAHLNREFQKEKKKQEGSDTAKRADGEKK